MKKLFFLQGFLLITEYQSHRYNTAIYYNKLGNKCWKTNYFIIELLL